MIHLCKVVKPKSSKRIVECIVKESAKNINIEKYAETVSFGELKKVKLVFVAQRYIHYH